MNSISEVAALAVSLGCDVRENAAMSEYTSFKTGGAADLLISVYNTESLVCVLKKCTEQGCSPLIIGNGSNLLVSDDGVRGVVIRISQGFDKIRLIDSETVFCEAGTKLAKLCNFALDNSLSGLEFAYGIPGSAGGAAYMNAGAYGGEMKDVLVKCEHLTGCGEYGSFFADELDLSYRHSVYSENDFVITGLTIHLKKGDAEQISAKMKELLQRRVDKQPLDFPSAGSFFKRPEDNYAGALIEQCGLKGFSVGGAAVSEKHAGFIINKGGAKTADILALCEEIQRQVYSRFNIMLEREVKYIG